jgi:hypothetical protein
MGNEIANKYTTIAVAYDGSFPATTREANARLIAAAPDLLASISMMLADIDRKGLAVKGQDLARTAIAKAKGDQ